MTRFGAVIPSEVEKPRELHERCATGAQNFVLLRSG